MRYFLIISLLLPALLLGTTLIYNVSNPVPDYDKVANEFITDGNSGMTYTTAPGSYRLPVRTVNIILPADAENVTASYTVTALTTIAAGIPELNSPYSDGETVLTSRPALQPTEHVIYQGTGKWGDVLYARFALIPALYDSQTSSYTWTGSVSLQLDYSVGSAKTNSSGHVPQLLRQDPSFVNREAFSAWYSDSNTREYDYLVVTTPSLYNAAQSLVAFHQSQGLVTSFADINTILATSPGSTPADKLRNYLITEYIDAPFSYLLLIGDIDLIPIAYLTPEPGGFDTVPSDFYYSDLSSNFDADNDGRLGEYDSGMDYTPEVFVGRIPWNDAAAISQIAARIVSFETSTQPWKHKALLPAAILNYAHEDDENQWERTDGATFMEYCKSTALLDYQTTTMYEQAGLQSSIPSDYPLTSDDFITQINTQSWGLVNWSAHGNATYSARKIWAEDDDMDNDPDGMEIEWYYLVSTDNFNQPANPDGSVYFCASCYNGMIDNPEPSLGEILIRRKSVADIAATRTGWYKIGWANPGWGGLSSYNYHFLENYANHGMTVGQAHGYANWLHTQYCLFGDPVDSNGIIWPELQNIYTYLLFGDPAVGYPSQTETPAGNILVWEPTGNAGLTVVNGLLETAPFNVVYTDHLIDTYNYLNQFDAVFCLFGLGYGQNPYYLTPDSLGYGYLLDYLQQGGKVYMEGMVNWSETDSLLSYFGTIAPFDHLAFIELIRYDNNGTDQFWGYDGYNNGTQALATFGTTSQPLFWSYNQYHVNDIIGIWNRVGDTRTISSSFNLSGVYSDYYLYSQFLGIILDTLDVWHNTPVPVSDDNLTPSLLEVAAGPNPFREGFSASAKSETPVTFSIYNIKGQLIRSDLVRSQNGKVDWRWNPGKNLASGIYLLKLDNGSQSRTLKTLKLN
jgi:hypothetical protein